MAEFYHFSQPEAGIPERLQDPKDESPLMGYKAVAWKTSIANIQRNANHVETTIAPTGALFPAANETVTVQFQKWWGRKTGIKMWDGVKYGYNVDKNRVAFGGMIGIPANDGPSIGYATFYLRGQVTNPDMAYWLQFSLFDERGKKPELTDQFYWDPFTKEAAFTAQLGNSKFFTLNPNSYHLTSQPFNGLRFFGGSVSRQQLWNIMTEFNNRLNLPHKFPVEPNQHRIFAFGGTPELGAAKPGGSMKFIAESMFVRTEY